MRWLIEITRTWKEAIHGTFRIAKEKCKDLLSDEALIRVLIICHPLKCRCQDRLYGLSSNGARIVFNANVKGNVEKVLQRVGKLPVLVHLFQMQDSFPMLKIEAICESFSERLKVNFGTQCPIHFLDKHIDYKYQWNVWDMRRSVLSLADLRQKLTHSVQTHESHFRRENCTQVGLESCNCKMILLVFSY